ncbi:efflux RND transporter periplasmic adaptor subunit [Blastomonas fulva]|uniref:efflux RND transporter periplasmic adaptor subunit n=1 Tax=Blastomonas fulva TaxID=1550728 RepID=UPI003D2DB6DF
MLLRVWGHKWPVIAAILGLVAASYAAFQYLEGELVPVEIVVRADLIETVVASGHVESPYRVEIASQIIGTVVSVAVREGETVRQGQPLIVLAAEELLNAAAQAQASVAQADANVRQISELALPQALEAHRSAKASLLSAQQVFGRTSTLMAQGFVTRAYFDQVTRDRDVALTQVGVAAAQVRSARSGGSGLAAAAAALAQAKAGAAAAQSRLGYTTISAPRSGILISRSVERGMVVTPGETLMLLSPGGDMQIVLQIDERNLGRIAVRQTARVSADAYPGQRFAAIVSFINPGIDIARASATVKLTVVKPPAYLRQNMTVSVDIETARRPQVLSLPVSAVHDALAAAPWVIVVEDGRAVRRPVRIGLQGNRRIQILGGVDAGTQVIPATSDVAAGARVRAKAP